ncbi:hypothetical protein Lal_00027995 [Lupinus albus]|nr:hypothetical protein Lal_00027995 [Lupinus albus]
MKIVKSGYLVQSALVVGVEDLSTQRCGAPLVALHSSHTPVTMELFGRSMVQQVVLESESNLFPVVMGQKMPFSYGSKPPMNTKG